MAARRGGDKAQLPGPAHGAQLPAVRGDGSGAERSAVRVVDPLLTPAVFTSPLTADTRAIQL